MYVTMCRFGAFNSQKLKTTKMETAKAPTKKVTLATVKSFVKKNTNSLYVKHRSSFDGMIDGLRYEEKPEWLACEATERNIQYTLGIDDSVWFVGRGNDSFEPYADGEMTGYKIYNACGSFVIAIKTN